MHFLLLNVYTTAKPFHIVAVILRKLCDTIYKTIGKSRWLWHVYILAVNEDWIEFITPCQFKLARCQLNRKGSGEIFSLLLEYGGQRESVN